MSGTVEGGKRAAAANLAKDPDFYKKIAYKAQEAWKKNGKKPRGFAHPTADPRAAGKAGGIKSKRTKKVQ